jgi:lysophospholipase L1-like esterase
MTGVNSQDRGSRGSGLAYFAGWLIIAVVALAGCSDKVPRLPRLAATDVIVAFGDSLTFGTGAAEHESYPAVLASLLGREVIRSGVPGEVTAQGLQRLPDVIEEHKPRLIIVCLGGNDMLRKVAEAEIRSNLRTIVRSIKDQGIGVVLIGVPKPALITGAAEFYADIAKEYGIPYEGKVVTSVLYAPGMKADPIHPNASGYRRIAEAVAELLRRAGAL